MNLKKKKRERINWHSRKSRRMLGKAIKRRKSFIFVPEQDIKSRQVKKKILYKEYKKCKDIKQWNNMVS